MKFSVNSVCPCGSGKKYKKCCRVFHNGQTPQTALELMKSRYSAYACHNESYIMETTHTSNSEYNPDKITWAQSIKAFMDDTAFNSLEILEFIDANEESFVTFKANILIKENDKWFYISGEFSQS